MKNLAMMLVTVATLSASGVSAQTAAASASITIPQLLSIGVTNTTVTFAQPAFTDYDAGEITATSAASVITTRGNVVHDVTVAANAAAFTWAGTGTDPVKGAGDLQWSKDGSTWNPLSTTATDVLTALGRGSNAAAATVNYKMLLNEANDIPGTYSLNFTYTVVAN